MKFERLKKYAFLFGIDIITLLVGYIVLPLKYAFVGLCVYTLIRGVAATVAFKKILLPSVAYVLSLMLIYIGISGFNFAGVFNLRIVNILLLILPVMCIFTVTLITKLIVKLVEYKKSRNITPSPDQPLIS